jgi:hypothetical protein
MSLRQGILFLIALGLPLGNGEASDPTPAPSGELQKLARARLEAARRVFEGFWRDKNWRSVELPYTWSRRWLKAQCQVSDKHPDRVAAFQAHLDRMRDLERVIGKALREGLDNVDDLQAAAYFVVEASEWLARAQARGPGSVKKP